jgi:hypothetical protein
VRTPKVHRAILRCSSHPAQDADLHYLAQVGTAVEALVEYQRQLELAERTSNDTECSTRRDADRQFRITA